MKNSAIRRVSALASASIVSLSVAQATQGNQPQIQSVDLQRVNQAIASALGSANITESKVSRIAWKLDPAVTNIERDRYKSDFEFQIKNTEWSPAPVSGRGSFDVSINEGRNKDKPLLGKISLAISTDAAAFTKHVFSFGKCPVTDKLAGLANIVAANNCDMAARLRSVTTNEQLADAFDAHVEVSKRRLTAFVSQAQADVNLARTKEIRLLVQKEVDGARKLLASLGKAKITPDGKGFTFQMEPTPGNDLLVLEHAVLTIKPNYIGVSSSGRLGLGKSLYLSLKPELLRQLRGLESNDEFATKLVQMQARMFSTVLSEFVSAKPEKLLLE